MKQFKNLFTKQIFSYALRSTLYAVLIFISYSIFFTPSAQAACYCVDPVGDQCRCSTSADAAGASFPATNTTFPPVRCDTQQEANSEFVNDNAICGDPYNPEIIPYCAYNVDEDGNRLSYQVTCYGTGFTTNQGNIPLNTGGTVVGWSGNVEFNGFVAGGVTQLLTCWANNFCCTRSDLLCDDSDVPPEPSSCQPQDLEVSSTNLAICAAGPSQPGTLGGSCSAAGFRGGTYYNACTVGTLCDLDELYYSPGDYIFGPILTFRVGEIPKTAPHPHYDAFKQFICPQNQCDPVPNTFYCDRGAIQRCSNFPTIDNPNYCFYPLNPIGQQYCTCTTQTNCQATHPQVAPLYQCDPSGADNQDAGWFYYADQLATETGSCQDMQTQIRVAFTPGHVITVIPHLQGIWENTVNRNQAIFSPFRTEREVNADFSSPYVATNDWPGESTFNYSFQLVGGPDAFGGFAQAGDPDQIHPPDEAKVYFKYLGYILCARENILDKLSPININPTYQYYDARCDNNIW